MVYTTASQVRQDMDKLTAGNMVYPRRMFMVRPTFFSVDYVINPHMAGNVGTVNKEKAMNQWEALYDGFASCGMVMATVEGQEGLPDMVFCANQSLPFITEDGERKVLMSRMHSDQRKSEVTHIQKFYETQDYDIATLDGTHISEFEGMGDAIWHMGKKILWGGYGFRTSMEVYDHISQLWQVPVLAVKLLHPEFYHLDTCFCVLNEESVLIYPGAFDAEGLAMIRSMFSTVIEANTYEAEKLFACNATCPDGKNVFIQAGCTETNKALADKGFHVHEMDTTEFLKSGGSVFCMKLIYW